MRIVFGRIPETQHPESRVIEKTARLGCSISHFSLQEAVDQPYRRCQIVEKIADTLPHRCRKNCLISLCHGFHHPEIEFVIDVEHEAVPSGQRVCNGRRRRFVIQIAEIIRRIGCYCLVGRRCLGVRRQHRQRMLQQEEYADRNQNRPYIFQLKDLPETSVISAQ